jgi:ATP-dependent helicase HepA
VDWDRGVELAYEFVRSTEQYKDWGIGKVLEVSDAIAQVEYFNSPLDDPSIVSLPLHCLSLRALALETRIYWLDQQAGVRRVGRVTDGEGKLISVRLPNGDNRVLPAREVFVRWNRPITDPTPYLANKINETPLFAYARSGFVERIISQRAACQGMSALISSVIDLEAHQIEVVRRVLQDPVQRYLLADEVGLGKTIEAGVIIRQFVLDDPNHHRILIVVPKPLAAQWRDELKRRFLLGSEMERSIRVLPMSDHTGISRELNNVGMLVIDEAHHLSSDQELYKLIANKSRTIPRVLLLSATPVLRNERSFLGMLHVLDPSVFSLTDEESFRNKVIHRQALAETVAGLVPENLFQLDAFLDGLVERFPDDALLSKHVETLRNVLVDVPDENDPKLLEPISKSSEEDEEAGELHEAKEVLQIKLPADKNATLPLYPGEEAFNQPAPGISPKPSSILGGALAAIGSVRRDHLDTVFA